MNPVYVGVCTDLDSLGPRLRCAESLGRMAPANDTGAMSVSYCNERLVCGSVPRSGSRSQERRSAVLRGVARGLFGTIRTDQDLPYSFVAVASRIVGCL